MELRSIVAVPGTGEKFVPVALAVIENGLLDPEKAMEVLVGSLARRLVFWFHDSWSAAFDSEAFARRTTAAAAATKSLRMRRNPFVCALVGYLPWRTSVLEKSLEQATASRSHMGISPGPRPP
jgi:hypothetical protein